MEHTFLASYVCLLIGNLMMECKEHEMIVRKILRNQSFVDMVQILDKYYNFLNLTASVSTFRNPYIDLIPNYWRELILFVLLFPFPFEFHQSEAIHVTHMKETKRIIQFMKDCDLHSSDSDATCSERPPKQSQQTQPVHSVPSQSTYSSTPGENRWASNSNTNTSSSSNSLFNKIYFSDT